MLKHIILSRYRIVVADFKSVKNIFLSQKAKETEVDKYISNFKELRDRHKIKKSEDKNIDNWGKRSFDEFKTFVDELLSKTSKSQIKKYSHRKQNVEGAEFITENEGWVVYKINSYKASKLLGSREWCIVREEGHWNSHNKALNFYYILSKNRDKTDEWYKIALGVTKNLKHLYWDNYDKPHEGSPTVPNDLNLPKFKTKFEFKIKIDGKLYTEEEFYSAINLKVSGDLYLTKTHIKTLPENLTVGGFLILSYTPIEKLPENLTVGGSLDLSYTPIKTLPDSLDVKGNIYVDDPSKIECNDTIRKKLRNIE